jgi:DNA-nicking Smr family endonuclease
MRPPRRLSPGEAALWAKLAQTVTPLDPFRNRKRDPAPDKAVAAPPPPAAPAPPPPSSKAGAPLHPVAAHRASPSRAKDDKVGLDASWERKFSRGTLDPDFSLDLHGATLDQAYTRLMRGLTQAKAMQARVVLVVTGKARPIEAADRGKARGAIRAKIVDWLGASEHAGDIAAIRGAHRRHGGQGALYIVLKRRRLAG